MRVYLFLLGAGLLVGIIYSLLNVRSPAPPMVALVGLFGHRRTLGLRLGAIISAQKALTTGRKD
jgi:XapX domain-containing protein